MKTRLESVINLFWLQESQEDISHAVALLTAQTVEKEQVPEEASTSEYHREPSHQYSSKSITGYTPQIICTVL